MESIALNFVPLKSQQFSIPVYRKIRSDLSERNTDRQIFSLLLPVSEPESDKQNYWLCFESREGYEKFVYDSQVEKILTNRYVFFYLLTECNRTLKSENYSVFINHAERKIKFFIKGHAEGKEVVWVSPYYLEYTGQYGFLLDFKFDRHIDQPFNRRIQQLSLSLDNDNKPNKNLYFDKFDKLKQFAKLYYKTVFQDVLLDFGSFVNLPTYKLAPKEFIFKNGRIANSPSTGLNSYGPYKGIGKPVVFYFYRSETERDKAFKLYDALTAPKDTRFYKGLQQTYSVVINQDNIKGLDADKYRSAIAIEDVANRLIERHPDQQIIILAFSPHREDKGTGKKRYLAIKYGFAQKQIPVQFTQYNTITSPFTLNSALPNLALAVFAKLGGYPWKVKASNDDCLVIGVSQTVHRQPNTRDKKYVAYSVLLDTGGIYKSLEVLSTEKDYIQYISKLKDRMRSVLTGAKDHYKKVVLHVSFKLRQKELNALCDVLKEFGNKIDFVVIRINTGNDFWGYNQGQLHLTPTRNYYVPLSDSKFLLWLDGVNQTGDAPNKRYSGPEYVDFFYANKQLTIDDKHQYLQDLLNLSGANWRGMNAKAVPVSIQYCKLVANYIKDFKEYLDIDTLQNEFVNPWFL